MDGRCLVGLYWWVSGGFLKHVWRVSENVSNVSGICLEGVWKVFEGPRLDRFRPIWPWKIFGSVQILWCLEVVWRVSIVTQWVV